jgi:hypothetical protein
MGQFTIRFNEQSVELKTVPGSARIKVQVATSQEFFFDPDLDRYVDTSGASDFDPQTLGIDRARLTQELLMVDKQRRLELQKHRAVHFESGESAK